MQHSIKTLFLFFMLTSAAVAGAQTEPRMVISREMNASADAVWSLIRKLDDIHKYTQLVARVEWSGPKGAGGQRVCYAPGENASHYTEKVLSFDDPGRNYTYQVVNGLPVAGMVNTFRVLDLGYNRCLVVWSSTYQEVLPNPQMNEAQFRGFLEQGLSEMLGNIHAAARKS